MVYFDNSSTTRTDTEVAALAVAAMTEDFGNPSSLHMLGTRALDMLTAARHQIAKVISAPTKCVFFTSGGTEANNLAILGALKHHPGKKLVTTAIEHSSVLDTFRHLEKSGYRVTYVMPRRDGKIHAEDIVDAVDADTAFVSAMAVNNETGEILPIAAMARGVREKNVGAVIHCDCVQGLGKIPFKLHDNDVDLVTMSAHKIHGPKGAGAVYVRENLEMSPLCFGGAQEGRFRPGTENVPLWAAFGLAADRALLHMERNRAHVARLREVLVEGLSAIPGLAVNSPEPCTSYLLNVSIPGLNSDAALHALSLRGIYLSSGAACSRGAPSHVLKAMGVPEAHIESALRIGLSKDNSLEEAYMLIEALVEIAGSRPNGREKIPAGSTVSAVCHPAATA